MGGPGGMSRCEGRGGVPGGGSPSDHGGVLLHGRLQQPLQDRPFAHRDGSGGCRTGTPPGPGPPSSPAPPGPPPALSAAAPSPPPPSARGEPSAAPSPARPRGAAGARGAAPGPGWGWGEWGGEAVGGRALGAPGAAGRRIEGPSAVCWGYRGALGGVAGFGGSHGGHRCCCVPGRCGDALRSSREASVLPLAPLSPPTPKHSGRAAPTAVRRPNPVPFTPNAAPRSGCGAGTQRGGAVLGGGRHRPHRHCHHRHHRHQQCRHPQCHRHAAPRHRALLVRGHRGRLCWGGGLRLSPLPPPINTGGSLPQRSLRLQAQGEPNSPPFSPPKTPYTRGDRVSPPRSTNGCGRSWRSASPERWRW